MWSVLPIYTNKSNFGALEQALIQLWQPRPNTPFIYQFFSCPKGLIARSKFSSSRQFGTFSLWRKTSLGRLPPHNMFDELCASPPFPPTSTALGNHLGFGQQLRQALPHGEKTNSDPTKSEHRDVTSFDAWPTTSVNLSAPMPSTPSTEP